MSHILLGQTQKQNILDELSQTNQKEPFDTLVNELVFPDQSELQRFLLQIINIKSYNSTPQNEKLFTKVLPFPNSLQNDYSKFINQHRLSSDQSIVIPSFLNNNSIHESNPDSSDDLIQLKILIGQTNTSIIPKSLNQSLQSLSYESESHGIQKFIKMNKKQETFGETLLIIDHEENNVDEIQFLNQEKFASENFSQFFQKLKTIKICKKIPQIKANLKEIGIQFFYYGYVEKAIKCFDKCLQYQQKASDHNSLEKVQILNNLALCYSRKGEYKKALKNYKKCKKSLNYSFQSKTDIKLKLENNIAGLYRNIGKYEKAMQIYTKCLQFKTKQYGQKSIEVAGAISNIGSVQKKGDYEKALENYSRCLQIQTQVF